VFFLVYRASRLPEPGKTVEMWRREAERAGLKGLFLVRVENFKDDHGDPRDIGFDSGVQFQPLASLSGEPRIYRRKWWHIRRLKTHEPGFRENYVYDYDLLVRNALATPAPAYPRIPCVCPGWDNSPRRTQGATILVNSTPETYEKWLRGIVDQQKARMSSGGSSGISADSLVFINAWNEWAEGNHLEPCQRWGHKYLAATRRALGIAANQGIEYAAR